jgi:hypothetical protein
MPRRKARPETELIKLPKAGNFDQAIRKYLEKYQPKYSEKRLAFPLPKDRADLDGLISLTMNVLFKVPIVNREDQNDGYLFRKTGNEVYLINPLSPTRVKHSESLLDELAQRIVIFYIADADKIRTVEKTIQAQRDRIITELKDICSQEIPIKLLENAETAIDRCFEKLEKHQRIEIRKTPRAHLTKSLFDAFHQPPGKISRSITATGQDEHFRSLLLGQSRKLTKEATFQAIGLIYRHLGIEEGTPQQIADRIKKEYRSKAK